MPWKQRGIIAIVSFAALAFVSVTAEASLRINTNTSAFKRQPQRHCVTAPAGPPRCIQYIGQTCVRTAPNLQTRCWYQ